MVLINLIPIERIHRRRRRARLRGWATAAGCYAIFLVVAFAASRLTGSGDDRQVQGDLNLARSTLAATEVAMLTIRRERNEAFARLAANRAVGAPPDWSVLLALLAEAAHDDIVLRRCTIESKRHAPEPSNPRERGRQEPAEVEPVDPEGVTSIDLAGFGLSQHDVSQFLLRMERVPIFRDVRLHDTRREQFLDRSVVAFRIDLVLDPEGGQTR